MSLTFLPVIVFILSLIGVIINRKNIILLLICIEIMLLSMTINFLISGLINQAISSQVYAIFIVTVAAVESAIGLSIMISFYKIKGSLSLKFLNLLKG